MFPYDSRRKPGRPKAIPEKFVPKVIALYKQGFGYRAISRELKKENLSVSWSTVRRLIKKQLLTNTSCIFTQHFDVVPLHSLDINRHHQGITCRLKKSGSNKCLNKEIHSTRFTCKYQESPKSIVPKLGV